MLGQEINKSVYTAGIFSKLINGNMSVRILITTDSSISEDISQFKIYNLDDFDNFNLENKSSDTVNILFN